MKIIETQNYTNRNILASSKRDLSFSKWIGYVEDYLPHLQEYADEDLSEKFSSEKKDKEYKSYLKRCYNAECSSQSIAEEFKRKFD